MDDSVSPVGIGESVSGVLLLNTGDREGEIVGSVVGATVGSAVGKRPKTPRVTKSLSHISR